jgi:hypothetical protein
MTASFATATLLNWSFSRPGDEPESNDHEALAAAETDSAAAAASGQPLHDPASQPTPAIDGIGALSLNPGPWLASQARSLADRLRSVHMTAFRPKRPRSLGRRLWSAVLLWIEQAAQQADERTAWDASAVAGWQRRLYTVGQAIEELERLCRWGAWLTESCADLRQLTQDCQKSSSNIAEQSLAFADRLRAIPSADLQVDTVWPALIREFLQEHELIAGAATDAGASDRESLVSRRPTPSELPSRWQPPVHSGSPVLSPAEQVSSRNVLSQTASNQTVPSKALDSTGVDALRVANLESVLGASTALRVLADDGLPTPAEQRWFLAAQLLQNCGCRTASSRGSVASHRSASRVSSSIAEVVAQSGIDRRDPRHAARGAALLAGCRGLPVFVTQLVGAHHIRQDGTGVPAKLPHCEWSAVVEWMAVISAWSAALVDAFLRQDAIEAEEPFEIHAARAIWLQASRGGLNPRLVRRACEVLVPGSFDSVVLNLRSAQLRADAAEKRRGVRGPHFSASQRRAAKSESNVIHGLSEPWLTTAR